MTLLYISYVYFIFTLQIPHTHSTVSLWVVPDRFWVSWNDILLRNSKSPYRIQSYPKPEHHSASSLPIPLKIRLKMSIQTYLDQQSGVFSESFPTDIWYYFSTFLMRSICQSVNTYMKSYANLEAQRYVTYFFLFFHYMSHHWGPSINARILLSSAWEALIFTRKGGIVLFI